MKKIGYACGTILLILLLFSGCRRVEAKEYLSQQLEVDVSTGHVVRYWDDHGGFHGDGTTFGELYFSDNDVETAIRKSDAWQRLPLGESLQEFLDATATFFTDEEGRHPLPEVQEGYYYFRNRRYGTKNPTNEEDLKGSVSYNVTLAVYDIRSEFLYYLEVDT